MGTETMDLEIDLQAYTNDNKKVDAAIVSLESMMKTNDFVQSNQDSITGPMYELIQQSVESFCAIANIGLKTERYLPSNESFTRRTNIGEVTMEGLGEGIKNVYLSIINAVKSAFKWMGGLLKRLFGRNKDRTEKIEKLKDAAEVIKEEAKKANDGEQRDSEGWLKTIKLENPAPFLKICTERGMMTSVEIDKITAELKEVFAKQSTTLKDATTSLTDDSAKFIWSSPFPTCTDSNLKKQISRDASDTVYVSHEFGGGQYVYIVTPFVETVSGTNPKDIAKNKAKRVEGMRTGKVTAERKIDMSHRNTLTGDQANGDKIIELVVELNKALMSHVDDLKHFQSTKDRFLSDFENEIKKEGVNFFSSSEKKVKRDEMMTRLKLFKKTMDEPAVTYYGACDGLVATFAHLATVVLEMNRHAGKAQKAE